MTFRQLGFALCVHLPLASCTGTDTGNPVVEPVIGQVGLEAFEIEDPGVRECVDEYEDGIPKLEPEPSEISEAVGESAAQFVVLLRDEVSLEEYPMPARTEEDRLADDPVYMARATRIAESQVCALFELAVLGGQYVHSFVLINGFVSQMTLEQAVLLSRRSDVQSVELSQTDTVPPN